MQAQKPAPSTIADHSLRHFRRRIINLVLMTVLVQIAWAGVLFIDWDRAPQIVITGIASLMVAMALILGATWRVLARFAADEQRASHASHQARQFNEAVLQNAGVLVVVLDREGRFLRFNHAAEQLSGFSFEDVAGKYPWETVLPADIASATRAQAFDALINETSRSTATYTNEWQSNSGNRHLIQWFNTPLRDASGGLECVIAIGVDITERHRTETALLASQKQLQEAEQRYRALFEQSPDGIAVLDANTTRFTEFNEELLRLVGYTAQELSGMFIHQIEADENPQQVAEHARRVIENGWDRFETKIRTKAGEFVDVVVSVRALMLSSGLALQSVFRDISTLKNNERRLIESESRLAEAQRIARIGSWELDLVSNVLLWSDEIYRIFELDKSSFIPSYSAFLETVHPEDRPVVDWAYSNSLLTRRPYQVTHRVLTPSGRIKWVFENCENHFDTQGNPIRSVGTVQDITERKEMEIQLKASESRLRTIWETEPECVKLVDAQCRLLDMNPAGVNMIGADSLDQVLGQSVLKLIKPEYQDIYQQNVDEVFRGGTTQHQYEIIGLRGENRWVEQTAVPLRDPADPSRIAQMLAMTRDITERRIAEENLRRSEQSYRALFETLPDAVFILDSEGRIRSANRAASQMHGYSIAQLQTMNIRDLNVPADALYASDRIQSVRSGGTLVPKRFLVEHQRRDGSTFPVEVVAAPVQLDNETFILGIDRDISERVKAEDALRQNEERLRMALQAANQGLYDLNVQTGEAIVSPEYARMLGYDPAEFHESTDAWNERLHPDDRDSVTAVYRDYVAGKIPQYRVEFRQRTQSGDWKWILSLGRIISNDALGRPLRMIGTHTDISAIKEAQMQLRQSDQALMHATRLSMAGGLAAAIAHELNQPLGAIANDTWTVLNGLRSRTITTEQATEQMERACAQTLRAGNILRTLRSLVDRQTAELREISPQKLIEDSVVLMRSELQLFRTRIVRRDELGADDETYNIHVDVVLIQQVLLNLFQNALESMVTVTGRERVLTIVLRQAVNHSIEIEVTDTGDGLSEAQLARLTDAFYTTKPGNLGLGLSICRRIIQLHQGNMAIASKPGIGTTVTIRLPQGASQLQ